MQLPEKIDIHITFDTQTNEVQVRGPLAQKGLMINTLATAIQIVVNHPTAPQVLVAPGDHKLQPPNGGQHP